MPKICFKILLLLSLSFLCFSASAQKLPNKQEGSVWAPPNIKIDGKVLEWGAFKAYNNATDVFYTLANDDRNLYLVVQVVESSVITRVLGGGISFDIRTAANKKDNISFTYPVIEQMPPLNYNNKRSLRTDTSAKNLDSIMLRNNTNLLKACKLIRITGIPGLDTLTSVYNDQGVKVAGAFNGKRAYSFEIAIDLKLLNLPPGKNAKFNYQLRVNGAKPMGEITALSVVPGHEADMASALASLNAGMMKQSAPTDFWGEYTLAKKP